MIGELIALGGARREQAPFWAVAFVVITIAAASALMAWGLGWSIWIGDRSGATSASDVDLKNQDSEPAPPGSAAKRTFYAIGVLAVLGSAAACAWVLAPAG